MGKYANRIYTIETTGVRDLAEGEKVVFLTNTEINNLIRTVKLLAPGKEIDFKSLVLVDTGDKQVAKYLQGSEGDTLILSKVRHLSKKFEFNQLLGFFRQIQRTR
jgi:hypothetical protein